jgi:carboxylesterase type B
MQNASLGDLVSFGRTLRFAPALPSEGQYPLGMIQRGFWNRVPTMIGGASCESCAGAVAALGPASQTVTKQTFDEALIKYGLSGVNGSGVGPETLEKWYEGRIATEGRWRTFARILSDSGHACSTALHAEALAQNSAQSSHIWRYFFDIHSSLLPGATHGSETSWLEHTHQPESQTEQALEDALSQWWVNLAAHGDPNTGSSNPLSWTQFSLQHPKTLTLTSGGAVMNSTLDTERAECANWKPFLGWGKEQDPGVVTLDLLV